MAETMPHFGLIFGKDDQVSFLWKFMKRSIELETSGHWGLVGVYCVIGGLVVGSVSATGISTTTSLGTLVILSR